MDTKKRFRHELKYFVSTSEKQVLINRLQGLFRWDENSIDGCYTIRSLYFDDYWNSAYEEKLAGVAGRKKYRIRIYNYSDEVIKLECKEKQGDYIHKEDAMLTRSEVEALLQGRYDFLLQREEELCKQFYVECVTRKLRPAVIVDYERQAFVMVQGEVRITFDSHVRSAWLGYDIFDRKLPAYEVFEPEELVMEVKYTEYLPEIVRRSLLPKNARLMAASKYTMCLEKKQEICGR